MKNILDNIKNFFKDEKNSNKKAAAFFGFYFIFFVILFGIIALRGNKDFLNQEYEYGNSTGAHGILCSNCVFDYKVTIDGVLHDYYGKQYGEVESFKYNNADYYHDSDGFLIHKEAWTKVDNPYQFYQFLESNTIFAIMNQATLSSRNELDSGSVEYLYYISSNSLNQLLFDQVTDYDEAADSMNVVIDSANNIEKIVYHLDHFCMHRENCQKTLLIEMDFEMFGSVKKIDNPLE